MSVDAQEQIHIYREMQRLGTLQPTDGPMILIAEIERLEQWVTDCQSGMYVNCVYCGHRYGPREDTPVAMADVLREHIEQCPKHPLSRAKAEIERLTAELAAIREAEQERKAFAAHVFDMLGKSTNPHPRPPVVLEDSDGF